MTVDRILDKIVGVIAQAKIELNIIYFIIRKLHESSCSRRSIILKHYNW